MVAFPAASESDKFLRPVRLINDFTAGILPSVNSHGEVERREHRDHAERVRNYGLL